MLVHFIAGSATSPALVHGEPRLRSSRPLSDHAPNRRARFEREARAIAALTHPNVLAIHDVGSHDGTAYLVTELLDGETLFVNLRQGHAAILSLESTGEGRREEQKIKAHHAAGAQRGRRHCPSLLRSPVRPSSGAV